MEWENWVSEGSGYKSTGEQRMMKNEKEIKVTGEGKGDL